MTFFKQTLWVTILASSFWVSVANAAELITRKAVLEHYADMAHAAYSDSLATAKTLQGRIKAFLQSPREETFQSAKTAWLTARIPYGQTEVFRFGNPNVDDWEGQVNAWPLDEGLIDYVAGQYEHEDGNEFAVANVIAGDETITLELLKSLHEKGGSEANVATGYHAIEFLLWGQDLNTDPQSAGTRPYTDYVTGADCTHGHCGRRGEYLSAVTDLLVQDLETMVADWNGGVNNNYRQTFLALDEREGLRRILFGMGSLSLGELAGERINVALLAHSQEDEHSCFSDNTHIDIAENARGIQNVYLGTYTRTDGNRINGASLADLVAAKDSALNEHLKAALETSQARAQAVVKAAQAGEPFDQQIVAGNKDGNQRVKAIIQALRAQTSDIEAVSGVLGIANLNPESSDSLGN